MPSRSHNLFLNPQPPWLDDSPALTWARGVSQLSHRQDDKAPTESQGLRGAHERQEWPSPAATGGMWPRSREGGLDGAGRDPRAGGSGGTRAPACPEQGSQLGAWGWIQEVPDCGGRASRGPGHPPGTREGSSREGEPPSQAVHSSSPGSARAPAPGLVGTLPRCLCTPSSARGPPGRGAMPAPRLPGATPSPRHRLALV